MRRALLAGSLLVLAALAVAAPAGAGDDPRAAVPPTFRDVFEHADAVEVVSIDPKVHRAWGTGREDGDGGPLARWRTAVAEAEGVYGRVAVTDPTVRTAILAGLAAGVAHPGPSAACYDPRHAIVARRGDVTVTAHLCFACNTVVFLDAATATGRQASFGDPDGLQARLDGLLTAAKVPRARDLEAAAAKAGPRGPQLSAPFELFGLRPCEEIAFARFPAGQAPRKPARRAALSDQLYRGYARGGDPAPCFLPRHALVLAKGPRQVAVFLCFECSDATAIGPKTEGGRNLATFSDPGFLQARLDLILSASGPPAAR